MKKKIIVSVEFLVITLLIIYSLIPKNGLIGITLNSVIIIILSVLILKHPRYFVFSLILMLYFDNNWFIPFTTSSVSYIFSLLVIFRLMLNRFIIDYKVAFTTVVLIFVFFLSEMQKNTIPIDFTNLFGTTYISSSFGINFTLNLIILIIMFQSESFEDIKKYFHSILWVIVFVPITLSVLSLPYLEIPSNLYDIRNYRFTSFDVDPNYYAFKMLISFVVTMTALKSNRLSIFLGLVISFFVFLTFSRAAILGYLILLIISSIMRFQGYKIKSRFLKFAFLALIGFTAYIILFYKTDGIMLKDQIYVGYYLINDFWGIISSGRTNIWMNGFQEWISRNDILLGSGFGLSPFYSYSLFRSPFVMHNGFLDLLFEKGIIGTVIIFILFKFLKGKNLIKTYLNLGLLIVFIIMNLTLSGFWTKFNFILVAMILITSYTISEVENEKDLFYIRRL